MTTIDHQQAAVEAIARMNAPYAWRFHDTPGNDPDWSSEIVQPSLDYAAELIQAATPHLRAAWAAEIRAEAMLGTTEPARGYFSAGWKGAANHILDLLEGGGEIETHGA